MPDDPCSLDAGEMAAWRGWVTVGSLLRTAIARDLARDFSLSEAEYAVLVGLSETEDGRLRMTDLALGLGWSRSRLSHLVTRMEGRDLVRRDGCPSDARGAFAIITDTGAKEVGRAALRHAASVRRHFLDHLDEDQVLALGDITNTLLERLAAGGEPCPRAALAAATPDCPSSFAAPTPAEPGWGCTEGAIGAGRGDSAPSAPSAPSG